MNTFPGRDLPIQRAILLLSLVTLSLGPGFSRADTVAIVDARVVGVADGSVRPGRTVLIRGDRIVAIGLPDDVVVPPDADVLDADGGYLIPGLWDMHSHTWGDEWTRKVVFPLEIANGVVGIRNMAGDCHGDAAACAERATFEQIEAMEREIASGELLGPEIHNASMGTAALMPDVWKLRAFLTPHDACYVTLADKLRAVLVTGERDLAAELRKCRKRVRYLGDL